MKKKSENALAEALLDLMVTKPVLTHYIGMGLFAVLIMLAAIWGARHL